MPDIYIVLDGARVVGASSSLQGAELIRADEAKRWSEERYHASVKAIGRDAADPDKWRNAYYTDAYDRMCIVNTELQKETDGRQHAHPVDAGDVESGFWLHPGQ